jgi:hypothetical protein
MPAAAAAVPYDHAFTLCCLQKALWLLQSASWQALSQ